MKILFIDTEPIRRGAQIFISELSSFLMQSGEQTKIIYMYQNPKDSDTASLPHNSIFLGGDKHSALEKVPGLNPVLVRKLLKEVKAYSPDIIVSNGSRTLKYSALLRQLYKGDTKWIARWIDDAMYWNPSIASKWIYRNLIISQFDAAIGVSQVSLDSMIRHYGFKKPTKVIHRVFDPNKFKNSPSREVARSNLGLSETDEVLLFIGNLTTQKRPDRFLEIVKILAKTRPSLKALIVGDGPLRKELEKEVLSIENQEWREKNQEASSEESSVFCLPSSVSPHPTPVGRAGLNIGHRTSDIGHRASNFFFLGYQQDVSPYLAAADILILTSDTEGLPGVVLEAAHFEVPTIATKVGGISECLIDGKTGFLIPDRSIVAFSQKINQVLNNTNQRIQLGKNAKKFISQHFRMDQVAKQYLDFFQQIIN